VLVCCEGHCLTRFSSVFLHGGLAKGSAHGGCFDAVVVTASGQTVDRFLLFFLVAGAALIASVDAEDSFSSHSGGSFLGTDVAVAGLATRRRFLEVAFDWIGGFVPTLVFAAEGTAVGAAVRFFVRPRAAANGCFFSEGSLNFEVLLELCTPRFLEAATAAMADASVAVDADAVVAGRFLDPSKSSREVWFL